MILLLENSTWKNALIIPVFVWKKCYWHEGHLYKLKQWEVYKKVVRSQDRI